MLTRVLVTGGAGFVGVNLIKSLLREGATVWNFDALTYAANTRSLADISSPRYSFVRGSIYDRKQVKHVFECCSPECVIHLAAESHVDRSIDDPSQFIQTNVVGTFEMLRACQRYFEDHTAGGRPDFRFVHVSTDEVYGSLKLDDDRFTETNRYDPHSPYSASKAAADHLVRAWHTTYGLPAVVTHCSNNYGPWQHPEKLIPLVISKCLTHKDIPVYGNGENVRDWLFVTDHCAALSLIARNAQPGKTYNIGGNNERTNLAVVTSICDLLDELQPSHAVGGYRDLISFVDDRPGHDLRYAIDSSKLQHELGWRPTRSFEAGLRTTVRWYLDNPTWLDSKLKPHQALR